ncbi:hypothetical protein Tco_1538353 [Tanacetum coccineum]
MYCCKEITRKKEDTSPSELTSNIHQGWRFLEHHKGSDLISRSEESNKWIMLMNAENTFHDGQYGLWGPWSIFLPWTSYMVQPEGFVDPDVHPRKTWRLSKGSVGGMLLSSSGHVDGHNHHVGAVDWKSSMQSTTAMSATESEYIAASEAAMEAVLD